MSERRILITGGAGCLGGNLVEHFIPRGDRVLVIDNFSTSKRQVLPAVEGLEVVEGSITDVELVRRCFDSFAPTHVVHSAAAYKDPDNWREDSATNILGTINVVDAATNTGVSRLVFFQTALCYGRPSCIPIPVDHPTRPFTSYGISKTAGESYVAMGRVPWVSLRLANVTGPRLAIGPIPTFYKRLSAGQSCYCSDTVRDFLDMDDFLVAVEHVMEVSAPSGIFNVSSGEGHAIKEIFDIVSDHLKVKQDRPVPVVAPGEDDVPAVVLDPGEMRRVFDWVSRVSFEDTIRRMLAWYDRHGVSDTYSHLQGPRVDNAGAGGSK